MRRLLERRIRSQLADYAAVARRSRDLIENLSRRRGIAREPVVEPRNRARPPVKIAKDARWRVPVRRQRLKEVVGIRLRSINALESLGARIRIANGLERDAEVGRIRDGIENVRRDRIVVQRREEKSPIIRSGADAAVEPGALASRILLERSVDHLAIARDLRQESGLRFIPAAILRLLLRALREVEREEQQRTRQSNPRPDSVSGIGGSSVAAEGEAEESAERAHHRNSEECDSGGGRSRLVDRPDARHHGCRGEQDAQHHASRLSPDQQHDQHDEIGDRKAEERQKENQLAAPSLPIIRDAIPSPSISARISWPGRRLSAARDERERSPRPR